MRHTKGPWSWIIHDYSMASLVGPDEMIDVVLSVSPCGSCIEHNEKEWEWGRCNAPHIEDARLIAKAPEMYDQLASARAIMQRFVDKVDSGLARSTETYREMKQWMEAKDETGRTMDTA